MKIEYRELSPADSSKLLCSIILESKLQCPERASYVLSDRKVPQGKVTEVNICKHHLAVEIQLGNELGDSYVLVPAEEAYPVAMQQH